MNTYNKKDIPERLQKYFEPAELGLEPTFQEYINKLCDIFDEVKRVLKKEGTCWVNMGDTYGTQGGQNRKTDKDYSQYESIKLTNREIGTELIKQQGFHKCLLQIPSRFAIEMCNRGWILRNSIVWWKPNCMPSSVKDRFTVDYEMLFFFTKSKKYYFETQYEEMAESTIKKANTSGYIVKKGKSVGTNGCYAVDHSVDWKPDERGRNKRCVWRITTKPYKEAHFATYPEELCETPIKAGCPIGGTVLDPFFGAGTTGLVAQKLGKKWIGIELNEEYCKIAEKRINSIQPSLLDKEGGK